MGIVYSRSVAAFSVKLATSVPACAWYGVQLIVGTIVVMSPDDRGDREVEEMHFYKPHGDHAKRGAGKFAIRRGEYREVGLFSRRNDKPLLGDLRRKGENLTTHGVVDKHALYSIDDRAAFRDLEVNFNVLSVGASGSSGAKIQLHKSS